MYHRNFLPLNHKQRKDKDSFNDTNVKSLQPIMLSGNDIITEVGDLECLA